MKKNRTKLKSNRSKMFVEAGISSPLWFLLRARIIAVS